MSIPGEIATRVFTEFRKGRTDLRVLVPMLNLSPSIIEELWEVWRNSDLKKRSELIEAAEREKNERLEERRRQRDDEEFAITMERSRKR